MSYFLILAAVGSTFLGPRTELSGEEAIELGLVLTAKNLEYEIQEAPAPIFFQLDTTQFSACEVRDIGLDVNDESGDLIFGSEISSVTENLYAFRLEREYIHSTDMAIACDSGPDVLDHVYLLKLGALFRAI